MNSMMLSYVLGTSVFVAAFIISLVMLRSGARALLLSLVFSGGAALGFCAGLMLGGMIMDPRLQGWNPAAMYLIFASAGAIGGGVLAVFLLGKFSKKTPWRRS